jgi:amino acid adenylation domain-containing protein
MTLPQLLRSALMTRGTHPAIVEGTSGARIDYRSLDELSDRLSRHLVAMGVGRGDRVGLYLRKSIDGVASMIGVLKTGAAYVPVDPTAPASRNAFIHDNCRVKVLIIERRFESGVRTEFAKLGTQPDLIVLDEARGGEGLRAALEVLELPGSEMGDVNTDVPLADDLAYILYTSGSTGKPKGVMLSHRNAVSFVDWCSEVFEPQKTDVFSSHAPFHFDLSILDVFVSLKHGATLTLIPEETSKDPLALSQLIATNRITVWYSAPSILSLLSQFGRIREHDFSSLRIVLFAGEVFPVVRLREFKSQVPAPRYFNLYGPTETNVCTWFEIPGHIPEDRTEPYPIGKVCSNLVGRVVDAELRAVEPGSEGELCIAGPNVMQGYWELPDLTERGFLIGEDGARWYRTGDIVAEEADGNYRFVGRRDRMIKKRGYRVELGEIEACLYQHEAVCEAAVVATSDQANGITVQAHLSVGDGRRPSLIELKTFCASKLPLYMVPDSFTFHDSLPKTSTDKVDYQALAGRR